MLVIVNGQTIETESIQVFVDVLDENDTELQFTLDTTGLKYQSNNDDLAAFDETYEDLLSNLE